MPQLNHRIITALFLSGVLSTGFIMLGCEDEIRPTIRMNHNDPIPATPAESNPELYRSEAFARRVGLALDEYYAANGQYPENLNQLAPKHINADQLVYSDQDIVVYEPRFDGQAFILDYHANDPNSGMIVSRFTSETIPGF